ncbi:uncharacterized protein N0V89_008011 [Didymosphaeria variabile]|uniref:MYND-type domain-containing protein n=1 Tax=Didymosphaeria variabile TaxID=1932322 RepID=A0A9W8XHB6_9PLEO|nr:uncharacterized protein N0V89_008011 [Didymosphaeria variabile]KAJ4349396.1 hypothetical protein N0V89_008011 [Didymosphaeria variabile]
MAETDRLKCAKCARVPGGPNCFDGLILCKCKGRYYCNKACREVDADVHGPDCKTIEYLAQPEDMFNAPDMIKCRDKTSTEIARQEDVVYHLILVVHFGEKPKRARYIAPFVELAGLEQKIQEKVQDDFSTVIPSGAFLSELLHAPVSGLAGVEEVHIPFHGLEGSITFLIQYEKQNYIKYCYRSSAWSFEKLLYTVVVDIPKVGTRPHEIRGQYVTKVEVEATFGSMVSAVACVKAMVDRWNKEKGKYEGKIIPVDHDSVRGVMISSKIKIIELKHVRIITRTLWQAGALKGSNGKAIMVGCQDRDGFAQRRRTVEHTEQEKAATNTAVTGNQSNLKKRTIEEIDREADAEATSKRTRIDQHEHPKTQGETLGAMPEEQNALAKRPGPDEFVDQDRSEVKRIRVVEHVDLGEDEDGEAT